MYSENWPPTARQKRWHKLLGRCPCIATSAHPRQCQLHHVVGASAHQDGVWIGQYFVIPIWWQLHDPSVKHEHHVGSARLAFEEKYGKQNDQWVDLCRELYRRGFEVPPLEVIEAVKRWRR